MEADVARHRKLEGGYEGLIKYALYSQVSQKILQ